MDVAKVLTHHNLKQVVQVPTRENNISNLILTNLADFYTNPVSTAPPSNCDHNIVEWTVDADRSSTSTLKKITKRRVRHFPQSACDAFGRWCSSNKWFEDVVDPSSASELASSFTSDLTSAVDRFFPTKSIKVTPT